MHPRKDEEESCLSKGIIISKDMESVSPFFRGGRSNKSVFLASLFVIGIAASTGVIAGLLIIALFRDMSVTRAKKQLRTLEPIDGKELPQGLTVRHSNVTSTPPAPNTQPPKLRPYHRTRNTLTKHNTAPTRTTTAATLRQNTPFQSMSYSLSTRMQHPDNFILTPVESRKRSTSKPIISTGAKEDARATNRHTFETSRVSTTSFLSIQQSTDDSPSRRKVSSSGTHAGEFELRTSSSITRSHRYLPTFSPTAKPAIRTGTHDDRSPHVRKDEKRAPPPPSSPVHSSTNRAMFFTASAFLKETSRAMAMYRRKSDKHKERPIRLPKGPMHTHKIHAEGELDKAASFNALVTSSNTITTERAPGVSPMTQDEALESSVGKQSAITPNFSGTIDAIDTNWRKTGFGVGNLSAASYLTQHPLVTFSTPLNNDNIAAAVTWPNTVLLSTCCVKTSSFGMIARNKSSNPNYKAFAGDIKYHNNFFLSTNETQSTYSASRYVEIMDVRTKSSRNEPQYTASTLWGSRGNNDSERSRETFAEEDTTDAHVMATQIHGSLDIKVLRNGIRDTPLQPTREIEARKAKRLRPHGLVDVESRESNSTLKHQLNDSSPFDGALSGFTEETITGSIVLENHYSTWRPIATSSISERGETPDGEIFAGPRKGSDFAMEDNTRPPAHIPIPKPDSDEEKARGLTFKLDLNGT